MSRCSICDWCPQEDTISDFSLCLPESEIFCSENFLIYDENEKPVCNNCVQAIKEMTPNSEEQLELFAYVGDH